MAINIMTSSIRHIDVITFLCIRTASPSKQRKINNDVILINDVSSISEFHWTRTDANCCANQNHQANCSQSKSRYNILQINNNKQSYYTAASNFNTLMIANRTSYSNHAATIRLPCVAAATVYI